MVPEKSLTQKKFTDRQTDKQTDGKSNQRTIGPENAHLKPDLEVLGHHEMTLTLNTLTPLLTS